VNLATVAFPLLFAVVGALVYGYSKNSKLVELGRIVFFCGVLWLAYKLAGVVFHV